MRLSRQFPQISDNLLVADMDAVEGAYGYDCIGRTRKIIYRIVNVHSKVGQK